MREMANVSYSFSINSLPVIKIIFADEFMHNLETSEELSKMKLMYV